MSPSPTRPAPPPAETTAPETVLSVRGLRVTFHRGDTALPVVHDVDLDVGRGEVLALLGESGSGKSVTARAVMGLLPPNATVHADAIDLDGVDILRATADQRRALRGDRVSLVFQDALSALNPVLSVGAQLGELFRVHRGMSRRAARAEAVTLLGEVGIPAPAQRVRDYPHQFSGGMRQRILIAMAIALRPSVLIADEPTTALDVSVQAQILDLLTRLRAEMNLAVLLITHDLGVVCETADRVAVMHAGRVVEHGATADVLFHPAHPYTEALLRSVPQGESTELPVIPGSPPPPNQTPPGCAFAPRCGWAIDRCHLERPEPAPTGVNRAAACHRAEEVRHADR